MGIDDAVIAVVQGYALRLERDFTLNRSQLLIKLSVCKHDNLHIELTILYCKRSVNCDTYCDGFRKGFWFLF